MCWQVLGERYWSSGDPLQVLDVYLSVFTTGHYDGPGGAFNAADFTVRHHMSRRRKRDGGYGLRRGGRSLCVVSRRGRRCWARGASRR